MGKKITFYLSFVFALTMLMTYVPLKAQSGGKADSGKVLTERTPGDPVSYGRNIRAIATDKFGAYMQNGGGMFVPAKIKPKRVSAGAYGVDNAMMQPVMKIKGGPLLWGVIEYSDKWESMPEEERPTGVYSFTATNINALNPLLITGTNGPNGGGVFYNGEFHYVNYYIMYDAAVVTYTYCYDVETWQQKGYAQYGSDGNIIGTDQTYDPITGNVYGYFYNPLDNTEPMRFGTISYSDYGASVTSICQESDDMICIAADNSGQLFAISADGGFWKVDKTTGAKTLVDYTGVRPSTFRQSATFDRNTGKLYWTAFLEDYTSALYEVNPENGRATLVSEIPDNMEISCLYIPDPEASDNAPAAISDFAVSFSGSSSDGIASFTMPAETYGGEVLSGMLDYEVRANGVPVAEGQANAGESVSINITVEKGQNEIFVLVRNAAGDSPESNKVSRWVGYDVTESPADVRLEIDEESRKASLSWNAPAGTLHGGYLDAELLTYNVTRYPGAVEVAQGIRETSFSETLPDGELTSYYYEVVAVNGDMLSAPSSSNMVAVGHAFDVPFADDFSDGSTYGLYTVINSNDDDKTWASSNNCFSYFFSWSNTADDWLITPPVRLKAGERYVFSFDIKGSSSYDAERYAVAYGLGTDPGSFIELVPATELKSSNYVTVKETVSIEADGEYRFGIHALSDAYKGILSVTNIRVDNEMNASVPDSVINLSVTAAANGALSAAIKFTAPVNSLDGNQLTELSRIEVYRGDDILVSSIDNPEPGKEYSCTDNSPVNGYNTYMVCAYNVDGKGKCVSDSAYVGQDVPMNPTNVMVRDNGNGITLVWDAPVTEGVHGGYVDPAMLRYNIYDQEGTLAAENVSGLEWTYETDLESITGLCYYGVTAISDGGESSVGTSNYLVTGRPQTLPFSESFAGGGTTASFWWSYGNDPVNAFSFAVDNSYDHDMGSAYWFALNEGDYAYLNSGRITAAGAANPMLFFSYYAFPGDDTMLNVIAENADGDELNLGSYDIKSLEGTAGWHKAALALGDNIKNSRYFVLKFYVESDEWMQPVYIDDITIRDVYEKDIKNVSVVMPTSVTAGDSIEVRTTVSNYGLKDAGKFTVNLYADDAVVAEKDIDGLKFNSDTVVVMMFKPRQGGAEQVSVLTSIEYSEDCYTGNNASDPVTVNVVRPSYPVVSDLAVAGEGTSVELTWSAPEIADNVVEEGFESFSPWTAVSCEGWTLFDGDKEPTNAYTAMWYPHIGEELSFIVFNRDYAIMDESQKPIFEAHSGDQSMAAFANVHDYTQATECDDWLITPELSGDAQTVSFWVKSYTDYQEDFYVYYSTDKADTTSLRKNLVAFEKWGAGSSWTKFEYDLPEGAKYFGLRYTSNLSGILVDDFTYTGVPLVIKGYNIYRDGELIGAARPDVTAFTDATAGTQPHQYAVTVVYNAGESDFSNLVSVATSLGSVQTDGAELSIYTADGIRLPHTSLKALKRGIYIVNGKKVVVK